MRAEVIALGVERRRVMNDKKHVEQVGITQHRRIESDPYDLGMTGVAAAYVLVSRIGEMAAAVAGFDGIDAGQSVKHRLEAPETAAAQRRHFTCRRFTLGIGHTACSC